MKPDLIVQKLWGFCNILRDDGMSYSDYVEQLTYMLFLKMAEEHSKPPFLHLAPLPSGYTWSSILRKVGDEKLEHYVKVLRKLGSRKDLFGLIYKDAISKFRDPAKFEALVSEIDALEWAKFDSDVKGHAYEGLLERTASEGKAGAGQYFTPRPLVDAIVEVMGPDHNDSICDPACGTGGFLLVAHRYAQKSQRAKKQSANAITDDKVRGVELVESVARLCLMNLVLHGIGGEVSPVVVGDALAKPPDRRFDIVLANPPFGRKSGGVYSYETESGEGREIVRTDFWANTSNKQLNFVQHIYTLLNESGRAAVVVPDNVLFEGGAGEIIRRQLLKLTNFHTLLRLPTGIFYAQGVKANVIFFDRNAAGTKKLWVYDLRTNVRMTLKGSPLKAEHLEEFIACFSKGDLSSRKERSRFKSFKISDLMMRDKVNLDLFWLSDKFVEEGIEAPEILASRIIEDLASALADFRSMEEDLRD